MKIKTDFTTEYGVQYKETLGYPSLFHWCCGFRMYRIISIYKSDTKGIHRGGLVGWICRACGTRKDTSYD